MYTVLGTCSICGGDVVVPTIWHSTIPPTPECRNCGAVRRTNLPCIEMVPNATRDYWTPMIVNTTPTEPRNS